MEIAKKVSTAFRIFSFLHSTTEIIFEGTLLTYSCRLFMVEAL